MAALTGSDLRYLHRKVGSLPVDADLQAKYDAYVADGALHPLEWVILEILETRLADLIRNPATFSVAGEYSQSTSANITALQGEIQAQRDWMIGLGLDVGVAEEIGFGILHAEPPPFRR